MFNSAPAIFNLIWCVVLLEKIENLGNSGEWEKARANYEALLRVDPYHFWGNGNMARSLSRGPRREDAPAYWVRRASGRPNDLDANSHTGVLYGKKPTIEIRAPSDFNE